MSAFWNVELKELFGRAAEKFKFHNPDGCEHCEVSGRRLGVIGRTLVAEVIPITADNREYLKDPSNSQPLRDWIHQTGRDTMHMHAFNLSLVGKIDPVAVQTRIGRFSKANMFDKVLSTNN